MSSFKSTKPARRLGRSHRPAQLRDQARQARPGNDEACRASSNGLHRAISVAGDFVVRIADQAYPVLALLDGKAVRESILNVRRIGYRGLFSALCHGARDATHRERPTTSKARGRIDSGRVYIHPMAVPQPAHSFAAAWAAALLLVAIVVGGLVVIDQLTRLS